MPLRVRHHTSDEGLAGIMKGGGIRASRGWGRFDAGVHVEIAPFGTAAPAPTGWPSPKNDLNAVADGAFVEFDAPDELVEYYCGPRRSGIIPLAHGEQFLRLESRRPSFVKVRRWFWQWWRTKVD